MRVELGFFRGDPLKLLEDAADLKPTIFPGVPRVFNRLYDVVMSTIEKKGGITKLLFDYAYSQKRELLKYGQPCTHWLWDTLVFNKIKQRLGGNVRICVSASAPISKEVMEFLRIALSCEVYEAFGQTESSACGTATHRLDTSSGHVGSPNISCEIVLEDIENMKYLHTDNPPRGEVLIRGHIVFQGYFKDEERTKEAIDNDGWLHTGDVGAWLPNGCLKIIDRKKNIFKTSQGEYIAPEKIENILIQSPYVQQNFVTGDSLQSYIVAIVVIKPDDILEYASKNNIKGSIKELCLNKEINRMVLDGIEKTGKEKGLNSLEIPKKIYLDHEVFSIEKELVTPTLKLRRNELKAYYQAEIDNLYKIK